MRLDAGGFGPGYLGAAHLAALRGCALKGATKSSRRARMRQKAVTMALLPACEWVPRIIRVRAILISFDRQFSCALSRV